MNLLVLDHNKFMPLYIIHNLFSLQATKDFKLGKVTKLKCRKKVFAPGG